MGVFRTLTREVLKILLSDGLLMLEPNRGAPARAITVEEHEEVFPLMDAFHALEGALTCSHTTPGQMEDLNAITNIS